MLLGQCVRAFPNSSRVGCKVDLERLEISPSLHFHIASVAIQLSLEDDKISVGVNRHLAENRFREEAYMEFHLSRKVIVMMVGQHLVPFLEVCESSPFWYFPKP